MRRKADGGFTLVELMVVVLLISILCALAFATYTSQRKKAELAQAKQDARSIAMAQYSEQERDGHFVPAADLDVTLSTQVRLVAMRLYKGPGRTLSSAPDSSDAVGFCVHLETDSGQSVAWDTETGGLDVGGTCP